MFWLVILFGGGIMAVGIARSFSGEILSEWAGFALIGLVAAGPPALVWVADSENVEAMVIACIIGVTMAGAINAGLVYLVSTSFLADKDAGSGAAKFFLGIFSLIFAAVIGAVFTAVIGAGTSVAVSMFGVYDQLPQDQLIIVFIAEAAMGMLIAFIQYMSSDAGSFHAKHHGMGG